MNSELKYIKLLENSEAEKAVDAVKSVLVLSSERRGYPNISLVKKSGWLPVPAVVDNTLSDDIFRQLLGAAKRFGEHPVIAMTISHASIHKCYNVPLTFESFDEILLTECAVVNFVLYSNDPEWLVIFEEEMLIVYGEKSFVEALAGDPETAREKLMATGNSFTDSHPDEKRPTYVQAAMTGLRDHMSSVYKSLSEDYLKAAVGEVVKIV